MARDVLALYPTEEAPQAAVQKQPWRALFNEVQGKTLTSEGTHLIAETLFFLH